MTCSSFEHALFLLIVLHLSQHETLAIKGIRISLGQRSSRIVDISTTTEENIGIASYRQSYDNSQSQQLLTHDKPDDFTFQRYQSPKAIHNALRFVQGKNNKNKKWQYFHGKDGRRGYISSRKLAGDWVLARSEQLAVQTTTRQVLKAYLTGDLQEKWNKKEVLKCNIECKDIVENDERKSKQLGPDFHLKNVRQNISKMKRGMLNTGKYYTQDLVLKSQRIITSHTGIMRYTQTIMIDQIGDDNYCVIIGLDDSQPSSSSTTATKCKPFDSLLVHVGIEKQGEDVKIYANGIMKVNRRVVPNLIIFDPSEIAGSMAGKGTLWLAAHFEEMKQQRLKSQK